MLPIMMSGENVVKDGIEENSMVVCEHRKRVHSRQLDTPLLTKEAAIEFVITIGFSGRRSISVVFPSYGCFYHAWESNANNLECMSCKDPYPEEGTTL